MRVAKLLFGEARDVAAYLATDWDGSVVQLRAALYNALHRIDVLEKQVSDLESHGMAESAKKTKKRK